MSNTCRRLPSLIPFAPFAGLAAALSLGQFELGEALMLGFAALSATLVLCAARKPESRCPGLCRMLG